MPRLRLAILVLAVVSLGHASELACRYPDEARALVTDWTGSLAAGYRAKLQNSPDDAPTLFLVGVSLVPKDLPEAVRDFDRAIAKDPRYPWPYFELMEVYANLQPDPSKLAVNMRAYRDLCPANGDAFRYLARLSDRAQTQAFAGQLRTLLEAARAAPDLVRYADLWAAEFRSAPPADFDALRACVRGDLKRLEPLAQKDPALLETLETGYRLTGQTEAANQAAHDAQRASDPALAAYRAWTQEHPYSSAIGNSPEAKRAYDEAQRKEAEDLAAKWPDSRASWMQMLQTSSSAEQASQAGEKVIQLAAQASPEERGGSYSKVAQVWFHHGVRLKDVPALAAQARRDLDRAESADGPVVIKSARELQIQLFHALERFDTWRVLLEAELRLGDMDQAARVPKDMQTWLAAHPITPDTPSNVTTFYPGWQGEIDNALGRVAEAQGHKADALAYYQRVILGWPRQYRGKTLLARAQALWKDLGGTDEGWLAWSRPVEPRPDAKPPVRVAAAPSAAAESTPGWVKVDRTFAGLNLSDLAGKVWTVADLHGKTTLIDVWASWCGPCTAELPHIQELYDKIKARTDVQLITLDVDENPGIADLFVKQQHYTFPVLVAAGYFAAIQAELSVPRTWIADKTGAIHLEKINSNEVNGSPTFVQDALDQLNRP